MKKITPELSQQVLKRRYASFPTTSGKRCELLMAGFEECAPNYLIERERFPFWTLEFVAGGKGYWSGSGRRQRIGQGNLFIYGPDVGVRCWNDRDNTFKKYFMVFKGSTYPAVLQTSGLKPGTLLQIGRASKIIAIIDQILDEAQKIDGQTSRIVSGTLEVLLGHIERHKLSSRTEKTRSRQVYELALGIIRQDYRELDSLTDIAERTGYSGEYICRVFRNHHGRSPYQVLVQQKMSAAWLSLRDGELKIGTIASELGYEDPMHFSRVFRKFMGCSPTNVKSGQSKSTT